MRKVFLLTFLVTNAILAFGQISPNKEKLYIPNSKVALIGYGSLMSIASMERTLGHPYIDKFLQVHVNGFERVWTFAEPNNGIHRQSMFYYIMAGDTIFPKQLVFLNIRENRTKSINACLFIIDTVELRGFDKRIRLQKN